MMNSTTRYDASAIQVLEGLEAVRRRPGMYIGSTDIRGLHHLIYEIVDNSVDEALAGYCDRIEVTIHRDGSVRVWDNGRGIPVDIHPKVGKSALEVIMTTLHAGGKFGGGGYKVSGGLHGVGASVVNALSEWLEVTVRRDGKIYHQRYERGVPVTPVETIGETTPDDHGTETVFLPDRLIFRSLDYQSDVLLQRFREVAYLTSGLTIHFVDERTDLDMTFYFEGGIVSFVRHLNRTKEVLQPQPFYVKREQNGCLVEVAIQYTDGYAESTHAFANNINTIDGGTHVTGFKAALTRAINEYARRHGLLKENDPNLSGEDVREGLTAIISVMLPEPQFEGQTKTKLGNAEVAGIVQSIVYESFTSYLEEHPAIARRIIEKCLTAARAREAARKARELVQRKGALDTFSLPGKL
ncbi:MAG: DNA topoisomerase IV subunit B, partial [Thermomicrobium sp.]|nr:DNA topoisomerase IV subunit B [Thermomicrobium sp.]